MSYIPDSGATAPKNPFFDCPELPAYEAQDGIHLVIWCAHCRIWHSHGTNIYGGGGHRVAHCHKPDSPYERRGYILNNVGAAPREVIRDMQRRRPRGWRAQP